VSKFYLGVDASLDVDEDDPETRRMRWMGMVDLPVNSTFDQTRVSRTGARLTARHLKRDGRGALMLCRCFMFQMFHSPPRPRGRDPQRAALQRLRRCQLLARGQNPTGQFDRDWVALLFRQT
jgi:hypothetical protein